MNKPLHSKMPDDANFVTASSGTSLTEAKLNEIWDSLPHDDRIETVLVALNAKTLKQWQKEYPGIKVVLIGTYSGYKLPDKLIKRGRK